MKRDELYDLAIKKFGAEAQIDMLLEEMSELQQALLKERRHMYDQMTPEENMALNPDRVVEEVADVEIMLEQIKLMYDIKDDVRLKKRSKKRRLLKLLKQVRP